MFIYWANLYVIQVIVVQEMMLRLLFKKYKNKLRTNIGKISYDKLIQQIQKINM